MIRALKIDGPASSFSLEALNLESMWDRHSSYCGCCIRNHHASPRHHHSVWKSHKNVSFRNQNQLFLGFFRKQKKKNCPDFFKFFFFYSFSQNETFEIIFNHCDQLNSWRHNQQDNHQNGKLKKSKLLRVFFQLFQISE